MSTEMTPGEIKVVINGVMYAVVTPVAEEIERLIKRERSAFDYAFDRAGEIHFNSENYDEKQEWLDYVGGGAYS